MATATDIGAANVQLRVALASPKPSPCADPGLCDFGKAFFGVVKPSPQGRSLPPPALLCFWGSVSGQSKD